MVRRVLRVETRSGGTQTRLPVEAEKRDRGVLGVHSLVHAAVRGHFWKNLGTQIVGGS